jgi:hypothetical protein
LHKAVKDGVDAGRKLEDLQASVKLSQAVDPWVGERSLKGQIKDAYQEITQGKPRGEIK